MSGEGEGIVPIRRDGSGAVVMLDQTLLPREEIYRSYETAEGVAEAIRSEGGLVERSQIVLHVPIKVLGVHEVQVRLHAEVSATVKMNVARSSDEAERQASGEDLTSAEAIYGVDEDAQLQTFDPDAEEVFDAPAEDADTEEESAS